MCFNVGYLETPLLLSLCASMLKTKDHLRRENVHFYRVGIGGKTMVNSRGWHLSTLDDLTRKYNESNVRSLFYLRTLTAFTKYVPSSRPE